MISTLTGGEYAVGCFLGVCSFRTRCIDVAAHVHALYLYGAHLHCKNRQMRDGSNLNCCKVMALSSAMNMQDRKSNTPTLSRRAVPSMLVVIMAALGIMIMGQPAMAWEHTTAAKEGYGGVDIPVPHLATIFRTKSQTGPGGLWVSFGYTLPADEIKYWQVRLAWAKKKGRTDVGSIKSKIAFYQTLPQQQVYRSLRKISIYHPGCEHAGPVIMDVQWDHKPSEKWDADIFHDDGGGVVWWFFFRREHYVKFSQHKTVQF